MMLSKPTFLLLARKAENAWHDSVRSWLCAAAHRLSLHIRAEQRLRRSRETTVDTPRFLNDLDRPADDGLDGPLREVTQRELRRLLEEELNGLPEKYRAPMVLCYLEGKTNQEAARQLGWATGSISRRLARARAILRERPRLRDLAITVGILGCLLAFAIWSGQPPKSEAVAQVMRQFHGTSHDMSGIEEILHRLESRQAVNPRQVQSSAWQTAQLVQTIRDERRGPWRQKADAARTAALELATVSETGERQSLLIAARKLRAACVDCHATYRQW